MSMHVGGPGVLLVVAVGVALGVFVGGILLTIAALFMKRFAHQPLRSYILNTAARGLGDLHRCR